MEPSCQHFLPKTQQNRLKFGKIYHSYFIPFLATMIVGKEAQLHGKNDTCLADIISNNVHYRIYNKYAKDLRFLTSTKNPLTLLSIMNT